MMKARSISAVLPAFLLGGCISLGSTNLAITPAGFATVHSFSSGYTTNEEIAAADEAIAKALRQSEAREAFTPDLP
jgi:hypothetical protein